MNNLTEGQFLEWARNHGLELDPKYPESAELRFNLGEIQSRFWEIPPEPEKRPSFILTMLDLMAGWSSCYAWKHLGSWPDTADPQRIDDNIELQILKGLGLPLGTNHVLEFAREEIYQLITLMFSTTIFGWTRNEDLYIVPDHACYIMKTDHHGVIHISFRQTEDLATFIKGMEVQGFSLPEAPPDKTFKWPKWMKRS